jgi:hypothetical protein
MSKQKQSSSSNSDPSTTTQEFNSGTPSFTEPVGANKAAKDAGYRNYKHFLESYGMRIWNGT